MSLDIYDIILIGVLLIIIISVFTGGSKVDNTDPINSQIGSEYDAEKSNTHNNNQASGFENREYEYQYENQQSDEGSNKTEFNYVSNSNISELNPQVNQSIKETVESVTDLPTDPSERRQRIDLVASQVCSLDVPEEVEGSSKVGDTIYRNTYQAKHTAGVLNDYMNAGLNMDSVEKHMRGLRKTTSKADKYAPVIGSYNRLNESSCAVVSGDSGAYQDFYMASAFFAADMAMLQYGVGYKLSFAGTRYAANRIGITRMINMCGNSCTRFLMSNTHHNIRGGFSLSVDHIQNKAIEDKIRSEKLLDGIKSIKENIVQGTENIAEDADECIRSNRSVSDLSANDSSNGISEDVKSVFGDGKEYIKNKTSCVTE